VSPAHTPTAEQAAVIAAFGTGRNLVIEAGAGTGKTSTLKMLAASTPKRRGLYVAYNRAIADDAKRDFPASAQCSTAHALAYGAVGRVYRHRLNGPRVPARETARILGINEPLRLGERTLAPNQVARLVMEAVDRFCRSADPEPGPYCVPRKPGMDSPEDMADLREILLPLARKAWADISGQDGRLRFSHDCYLKIWQLSGPQLSADYVLLDEAQDANPVILDVVTRQKDAQLIAVGDQCQPPGTLVTVVRSGPKGNRRTGRGATVTEDVPIEDLREGDRVVSFSQEHSYLRRGGSPVTGITARPYSGELVVVRAGDLTSRYTPDHHCIARFGAELADKHVVYLMRRGGDYRIGITGGRMRSQNRRIGVALRGTQEGADAVWVLSVHGTRQEAALAEIKTAWEFGVPTVTFRAGNNNTMSQAQLDEFWAKLGGNGDAAARALTAHGRSIRHPLWAGGERLLQTRRPTIVRACNLIEGMEVLPLGSAMESDGKNVTARRWERVTVGREFYAGPVYSLTVDRDHTYVGDGIITHNCQAIYGWRGAMDAMDSFPDAERLALSQSFRFGSAVAHEANKWLAVLRARLRLTGYDRISSMLAGLENPDAVLCRTNAEALSRAMAAVDAGRATAVVGGGTDIRRLAEAAITLKAGAGTDHPELMAFRTWGEVQDHAENDPGGSDLKVLVDLIDKHGPDVIIAVISRLVDERRAEVIISTVHKAKGREWNSVKIASDFREPKKGEDGTPGEVPREEAMLAYVAVTRARLTLDRSGLAWVDGYLPGGPS
jgi:hypothetical protein